jgi:tetratricopeptide (TPR) repeat protein
MTTVTFYSYKGGVGRTLALANMAKQLAAFGKKVCVLDFDLEAPGVHYKFQRPRNQPIKQGILDYIHQFVTTKEVPASIIPYTYPIYQGSKRPDITLIPAGDIQNADYWKKLAAVNWNDLFYKADSEGVPFFLDLKEKIKKEINPDFLLIDSRTGITEISGITTSLLADKIVVMSVNNDENLNGAHLVIQSLKKPENNFFGKTPEIIAALSRIPYPQTPNQKKRENEIVESAKRVLGVENVLVIHSDSDLELKESLKILDSRMIKHEGTETAIPIVEDYLALFDAMTSGILTPEEIEKFKNIKDAERLFEKAKSAKTPEEQIELLTEAIALNLESDEYLYRRANLYVKLKRYEQAKLDFEKSISLNSNDYRYYYSRGLMFGKQKKYDEAIEDLQTAEKLSPENPNPQILNLLGNIYDDKKDYEKAIEFYTNALMSLNSEAFDTIYNNRGNTYRKMGEYDKARQDVYKSLELNIEEGVTYTTLAEINAAQGNENEFYKNIELALNFSYSKAEDIAESIATDDVYKPYLNSPRFKELLVKYEIDINQINQDATP